MKVHFFFTIALLSVLFFGCQKEVVGPDETPAAQMFSHAGHSRPGQQCGSSAFTTLGYDGTIYGNIEILNDVDQLYILADMNYGWMLRDIKIYVGDPMLMPKGNGGTLQVEQFPFQITNPAPVDLFTYTISTNNLGTCFGVTIWARAVQLNMFGQEIDAVDVWADGSSVMNGFSFGYCKGSCALGGGSNIPSIL